MHDDPSGSHYRPCEKAADANTTVSQVKTDCLRRWFGEEPEDEKGLHFSRTFEQWIGSLPHDLKAIALKQMENFEYVPQERANQYFKELYRLLEKEFPDTGSLIISHIPRQDGASDSSIASLIFFQTLNSIPSENILIHSRFPHDINLSNKIIVFIDDFCGTGDTFINTIVRQYSNCLKDAIVVYAVLYCMEKGLSHIKTAASDLRLDVRVVSVFKRNSYYESPECENANIILRGSEQLGIKAKYALGYKQTQSLISFYSNTPNNTFGYIWAKPEQVNYDPIFPRKRRGRPPWGTMRDERKSRNQANYHAKC